MTSTAEAVDAPPKWLTWATLLLSVAGLGVSTYLTISHYNTDVALSCPASSTINCEKVTSSDQSELLGIPVAVLGLVFFVGMVILTLPVAWRAAQPLVHMARLGSVIVGIGFVLWLIYAELFEIDAICLWCTAVHGITFVLFCLVVAAAAGWGLTRR